MDQADVVVVGSLHFDLMLQTPYLPRLGETVIGEEWWWKPGGKGGNQAMAAAGHGARTEMVGCLGDDLLGMRLRERLGAADVGLGHLATLVQGSGMSVAIQQDDGDYAAIVVSGANQELQPAHVEAAAVLIGGSTVVVLQNEIAEPVNVAAATMARDLGARVILNAAPARPMGGMAGLVDVLVVNAIEAEQLGADPVTDLPTAAAAAAALHELSPAVVVTAGGDGVVCAEADDVWSDPAYPVGQPRTHGAGDVFVGALAARLALGDQLQDALGYANAAAALHVGTPEDQRNDVSPADVQALRSAPRASDRMDAGSGQA